LSVDENGRRRLQKIAIAPTYLSDRESVVLPFQGDSQWTPSTQGGAVRLRRGALPWAELFRAFQAKMHFTVSAAL
jgi:hypothetical protein